MRRILFIVSLLCAQATCAADLVVGQSIPEIEAKALLKGKVTIINFWATWCEPCIAEMPAIQSYLDKHKAEGLLVLAISMDEPRDFAKVQRMAAPFSFTFAMKADVNYKSLGRIWRMPSTFVIDRRGVLQKNGHVGDAAVTEAMLEALVTPLLAKP
jgi:thiol-disulfide isomerase/thioredoxin